MSVQYSEQTPFIEYNTDSHGKRQVIEVTNESTKITSNKAELTYLPSDFYKVFISNLDTGSTTIVFQEISINSVIKHNYQYKVNYQSGSIYFHSDVDGYSINISSYYSLGVIRYPASRIYTQVEGGTVTETLQDIIDVNKIYYQEPVATFSDIAIMYPSPSLGWSVQTISDNKLYRWDGTAWKYIQQLVPGAKGDKGDAGVTPNITVGTVATGNPGTNVVVTMTGTETDPILNFTIPRGDTGSSGGVAYYTDTASTDAYAITISGVTSYSQLIGSLILVKCTTANTNSSTLNVNSLGAKSIVRGTSTALLTGDILAGQIIEIIYDGTNFQLKNQGANVSQSTKEETLTNKTLTSPIISTISNTGTITLPTDTDTLIGRDTNDILTNKTLTSPKITSNSSINDVNGNELIKFPSAVASAVNEITISNAITGGTPTVAATGTDPNVNVNITSKGTGVVQANGYDILTTNTNTAVTPTVSLGMNSVIKKTNGSSIESIPKFTMHGKGYVNLLGKDGNCEDISK